MGIYDRDYNRAGRYGQAPGIHLVGPQTVTTKLIVFTAVVYLLQLVSGGWVTSAFELHPQWYRQPWQVYQLLTYGFLHSPRDIFHILLNMFSLWLFGREVEHRYGSREYLAFYLAAIVVAGLVWTLLGIPAGELLPVLGASGGVTAVVILFAFNFPYTTVLFNLLIPMPMWLLAVLMVSMDVWRAVTHFGAIAATAHLGGALFAALYYKWGIRLERWLPDASWLKRLRPRPKLRVHQPEGEDEEEDDTEQRVDQLLKKIQEHGQDSLTRSERQYLEEASREYQKKRR